MKRYMVIGTAFLVDILLVWSGLKLMFFRPDVPPFLSLLLGIACTFAAIFVMSGQVIGRGYWAIGLFILGVYYFLRAAGVRESTWISVIIGLACLAAALVLGYVALNWSETGSDLPPLPTDDIYS